MVVIGVKECIVVGDGIMFMGEYRHSIDAKGRLTLPSEFREEFDNCVVVAKGLDGCLNIYSVQDWEAYLRKLSTVPTQKKDARAYVRVIASRAKKCEFDKVGRINIPQVLRNEAHLDKNVVVNGNIDHIEIWNESTWDAYYEQYAPQIEEISEEMEFKE